MRRSLYFLLLFLFPFLLSACAGLPQMDYDALRGGDTGGEAAHLAYLRQQGERVTGVPFVAGNQVDLLEDGAAAYPAMLASIRSAQRRIDMESFTFDEVEGNRFADALLESRNRGVDVHLIYDAVGSFDTPGALFDRLRAGGVDVVEYNPVDLASVIDFDVDHRDHRKLLIIDGETAFVGGLNVSEVYRIKLKLRKFLRVPPEKPDVEHMPWRDVQARIKGPVVASFESFFIRTWREQNGPEISQPVTPKLRQGPYPVEALNETPEDNQFKIDKSLLLSIALARHSVHLTTGFFVPPPDLVNALGMAALRGVDVVLLLPSESGADTALNAGRSYYAELMDAGVSIYERQGVVLHAKTAVIDGVWSSVGSYNLDWRSALLNNECNAVILGADFGRRMEEKFQKDLAFSKQIDPHEWGQRPFLERLDEWKDRLFEYFL